MPEEKTINYAEIAQEVKRHLYAQGYSLTSAAKKLGMSQQGLSSLLSGRRITSKTAAILAQSLNLNYNYLMTGEGSVSDPNPIKMVGGRFPVLEGQSENTGAPRKAPGEFDILERILDALEDASKTATYLSRENSQLRRYIRNIKKELTQRFDEDVVKSIMRDADPENQGSDGEYIPITKYFQNIEKQ